MYNTNPTEARREALRQTRGDSLSILDKFPTLVACPVPAGGDHEVCYRDIDFTGPIMCTWREATILGLLAKSSRSQRALEVGCSVGWSSAHIAGNTQQLICVDPFIETARGLSDLTDLDVKHRFLDNMDRMGFDNNRVQLSVTFSPNSLADLAVEGPWDFVFIDGWHLDGQPLRDVKGVLPHVTDKALICLHDTNIPDVQEACAHLEANEWTRTDFSTGCHLALFFKGATPKWWARFEKMVAVL